MKRYIGLIGMGLTLLFPACATQPPKPVLLEKANVLPLQLDDAYQFRKELLFVNKPKEYAQTRSESVIFERSRHNWGAITSYDLDERTGNFFTFFWRTSKQSDVTVRLEYRQPRLANYVQAQELYYPNVKGSVKSDFQVTGDDFLENGQVVSWRALLIVDGKIVGLTQSYMWK
ncbi:MAG: hypothetical protein ABIP97_11635 [Chthoniobacterales bacterium]